MVRLMRYCKLPLKVGTLKGKSSNGQTVSFECKWALANKNEDKGFLYRQPKTKGGKWKEVKCDITLTDVK